MPELPDPIERLHGLARFGEGLEGGDMPLSPAAVRRRGDQIRRRRNALVAGGAALAVAALTVPVLTLSSGDVNGDRDRIAPDPGTSLGTQDLITDEDTVYAERADWFATDTFAGDGQTTFHPCAQSGLTAIGAEAVLQRTFELRNLAPGAPEVEGDHLNESIAEFESAAAAREAYDTVARWILDCEGRIADAETYSITPKARSVDVPTGGDAVVYDMHWGPVAPELQDPYSSYINETGIVVVGDRVAVLTSIVVGQDYTFLPEDGGTPVERMIPPAAERLRPDSAG